MKIFPTARFEGKSWLEIDTILKTEKEAAICKEEKQDIINEFKKIRETLGEMVMKNLTGPENEKIDLMEFYLDTGSYNQKKATNKEQCKETEMNMKALIVAQDKVTSHLKKNYLEPMGVPGAIIRGIFQRTMATSYTLLPPNLTKQQHLRWLEELRKVEQYMFPKVSFEPWLVLTKE